MRTTAATTALFALVSTLVVSVTAEEKNDAFHAEAPPAPTGTVTAGGPGDGRGGLRNLLEKLRHKHQGRDHLFEEPEQDDANSDDTPLVTLAVEPL